MNLSRIRNLGIAAHIDAGKTTVTERILFDSGIEHRIGQVDEGTAVMDWMAEERERGITITAAATRVPWRDHELNLIDTPGHVDFTVEVERCMRVLDGAVLVIDAVMGVQAQSETVWRQMKRHAVPAISFVNKCDRPGSDLLAATASLRERLGAPAIPVQYPIGLGHEFAGVVDLITRQTWEWGDDPREARPVDKPWPEEVADEIGVLRSELIDTLAEDDEELLAIVLEDREPEPAALKAAMRRRVIEGSLVPVLCGAALRHMGVRPLLDAIVDWLPSPLDMPHVVARTVDGDEALELGPDPKGPPAALAFKLHSSAHGDLTFARIYSGTIVAGKPIWNARARKKERVARILRMHAESGQALDQAEAGDIVALTGLKWTGTGDTLCERDAPILLERLEFPEPVITRVVEPASSADRDKLRNALQRLAHEDPSLVVREDEETGQWFLAGMGELHLEVVEHRLQNDFRVEPRIGQPRVAYREAVQGSGRGAGRVERTLGGKDIFGAVELELAPEEGALGPVVEWADGCPVPAALREAVDDALTLEAQVGPRFGYPLVNARIRVTGGESNPRVDAELGFAQAATQALRQAMAEAQVALLEPVMSFEIQTPAEFASGIIADLNARSAEVEEVRAESELRTVLGRVPLVQMFGYSTTVRSLSQGRADFSMTPAGYRPVPEEDLAARGLVWS